MNVRWSSHNKMREQQFNCAYNEPGNEHRRREEEIMIRFCEFAARDHDLDSEERIFHHEFTGFPSPLKRGAL